MEHSFVIKLFLKAFRLFIPTSNSFACDTITLHASHAWNANRRTVLHLANKDV